MSLTAPAARAGDRRVSRGTFEAFLETVERDDRQQVREKILAPRRNRADERFEYRVTWADGSVHWRATPRA